MGITVVQQSNQGGAYSSSKLTFTPPTPGGSGRLLVLAFALRDSSVNGSTVTSVTDATGNTYTQAANTSAGSQKGQAGQYYVNPSSSAGTTGVVTVNFTGTTNAGNCAMTWYEVSGIQNSPLDTHVTAVGSGSSPTASTGTLANSNEIVIAVVGQLTNGADTPPGAPWTNAAQNSLSAPNVNERSGYQIVSATTSITYTDSTPSGVWSEAICSYIGSSAGLVAANIVKLQAVNRAAVI